MRDFEAAGPDFEAAGPDFEAAGPDFEASRPDVLVFDKVWLKCHQQFNSPDRCPTPKTDATTQAPSPQADG